MFFDFGVFFVMGKNKDKDDNYECDDYYLY